MISLIVAASTNNVIGQNGELPWRLPSDLQRFKRITMGKPIVMGRKTWESIGRPLPGRKNIVLTRHADYVADGAELVTSPAAALHAAGRAAEVVIIGGGQIYDLFLPKAQRIYLTRVGADVDGDAYFPPIDAGKWQLQDREAHPADDHNEFDYEFLTYVRNVAPAPG